LLAGQAGTDDVESKTLRELAWMAEGVDRAEHRRLTRLEAYARGLAFSKKPPKPGEMDPYRVKSKHVVGEQTRIRFVMQGVVVSKATFDMEQKRHGRRK